MVGLEYQAEVPSCLCHYKDEEKGEYYFFFFFFFCFHHTFLIYSLMWLLTVLLTIQLRIGDVHLVINFNIMYLVV